jgi:GT2 family glycosyltransferase
MDKNLICSFGWKRKELAAKSLESLLKNKRKQDKLLIIDQEMHNWDLYEKNKKKQKEVNC